MTKLKPSVAMNSVIGERLTSGRSTTRSTAIAITTMTTRVMPSGEPEVDIRSRAA